MSKKYFINNLDTDFGQALISQLVKQPTEDPVHMCTVRVAVDKKPQGIKKILKRQKPKLFRKKAIEECQVYVYNINQTEISDIQFGIQTMSKPFQQNKVLILVSDIMVWSNTPRKIKKQAPPPPPEEGAVIQQKPPQQAKPQDQPIQKSQPKSEYEGSQAEQQQQKPIQYTFFEDSDFQTRTPLPKYQYIKDIEDKVLSIKRQNVKVFIICPGIVYGCGQDTFYELFKASWLQNPQKLPYLGQGNNKMPTIHLKDLVKLVIKVAENPPEGSPYILALDQTDNKTQKALIQAISSGIGSGKIQSVKYSKIFEYQDRFQIDLDMKSSKILIGTAEEPVQFEWISRKGITTSIQLLLKDFCEKQSLRPMKILLYQIDAMWKQSKINYILKIFSDYYRIPVLSIKTILQQAKEFGDQNLVNDISQEWQNIHRYLAQQTQVKQLNQTLKVFYRAIRWRLSQNDCKNRGYILQNFPQNSSQLNYVFNKISLKKFKSKKPKAKPLPPPPPQIKSQNNLDQNGQPIQKNQEPVPPPEVKQQQPKQQDQQKQQQPEEQAGDENAPKFQPYFPQSLIWIKKMGSLSLEDVVFYFTSKNMQELVYDTSSKKQHEIFESLRSYIERNGRPNNYLEPEQALLIKHRQFTKNQNKQSLNKRQNIIQKKIQTDAELQDKRKKLAEEIFLLVRNEGQQQIKKMPFRNYLMEFVVPTLNIGLLEISNIIPNDPVDLLAQFLYQKSYDV